MTVNELITAALRRIGVVAQGNTPSAENINDGLEVLNDFVDAMKLQRLTLYSTLRTTFTITANVRDYNVGTGQTVAVARPTFLAQVGDVSPVRYYDSSLTTPVELPLEFLSDQQWRSVPQKTLTGALPAKAYYNPTYPYGALSLWPTPTSSGLVGVVYTPVGVAEFVLGDTLALPPGYRRFLRDNLSMEMATEFDITPPAGLQQSAMESKADVLRANMRLSDLPIDAMWVGRGAAYNIETDE